MSAAARPRVFLTGATGTVGSGVLEVLAGDGGYDVTCLVRRPENAARVERFGAHAVIGDMADGALFRQLHLDKEFEFIVHAAQAHYGQHAQEEIDRLERIAVRNLELLCSPATRLMIFTGGVWSYGTGAAGGRINEQTPLRPFPATRQRVELVQALMAQREFPWLLLDPPSMVYGSVGPVAELARAFGRGANIDVLDDDSVLWSLIERGDLGRAYLALLQHGRAGDRFVVAEDQPVSVPLFYETIARLTRNGRVIRRPLAAFSMEGEDSLLRRTTGQPVDASLLKAHMGWRAQNDFLRDIGRLVASLAH